MGGEAHELLAVVPGKGVKWRCRLARKTVTRPRILGQGVILVRSFDTRGPALQAVDSKTRRVRWTNDRRRWSEAIAAFGDLLFCGSDERAVHALNLLDGTERWAYPLGGSVTGSAVARDGSLYVAAADGYVYAIAP